MKYRVKQTDDKFYPQYKSFLLWDYFQGESYYDYDFPTLFTLQKSRFYKPLYFDSLERANHFLKMEKEEKMKEKEKKTPKYYNFD